MMGCEFCGGFEDDIYGAIHPVKALKKAEDIIDRIFLVAKLDYNGTVDVSSDEVELFTNKDKAMVFFEEKYSGEYSSLEREGTYGDNQYFAIFKHNKYENDFVEIVEKIIR